MNAGMSLIGLIIFTETFFGFILLMRYFNYKEKLFLAEKGLLDLGVARPAGKERKYLIAGIILVALGLAFLMGLVPLGISSGYAYGLSPWLLFGFVPLFLGAAMILIYYLVYPAGYMRETSEKTEGERRVSKFLN